MSKHYPYYRRLNPEFGQETRFELKPQPARKERAALNAALEGLKSRLLKEKLIKEADLTLAPVLRRAANEAAALAWLTPYPLLLLPELLEEKVAAIRRQAARQADILRRSRTLAEEAA